MSVKEINISELEGTAQGPFEPIAVVGMGCIMPDAEDIGKFWNNIINAHVSIKEVPSHRWNIDDFWAPGSPGQVEYAKTYAKIGAFVEGYDFDWRRWKVPPGTLGQIDICQQWAVSASAAALEHAGYLGDEQRFEIPNASTGVVMANALGGEFRNLSNHRVWADQFTRQAVESGGMPESGRDALKQAISEGKPEIDEDAMPGELANVMAGRVANLLDLQGPNHSTDAACASTMSAVLDACRMLQARQVDLMLAGASDRTMDPATYAKFSAIGALSPTHSTPFDAKANGFVMGEGAGVLVLKRLDDAIEDGNDIHAVIRGIGASSDGRGKGITAPSQRGQMQALARAYAQAGFSPATVDLVEAHGTSTKVGDAMELGTLRKLWHESDVGNHVAVGSVKSQIGHLKAAAGIAGMLKTICAVSKGVIPPSAGFQTPNPTVDWDAIPFYVPTYAKEWGHPKDRPRRAGVSAFGFGGTNWHVVIEEFDQHFHRSLAIEWRNRWTAFLMGPQHDINSRVEPQENNNASGVASKVIIANESAESILDPKATPSMTWEEIKQIEGGILLLESEDITSLKEELEQTREQLLSPGNTFDEDPLGRRLSKELAAASEGFTCEGCRIAIIASSWTEFDKRSALALKTMEGKDKWGFLKSQGILITDEAPLPTNAKVAHMFPGQGSQYVGMTLDLSKRFSGVANVWNQADKTMVDILDGETLSSFVLRNDLSKEERIIAEEKLKQTEYTQPAMLTADLAINQILADHGRRPDMVAGHSLGEYAALMVSGILGMDGALRAAAARGTEMGSVEISDKGLMASVTADYNIIKDVLASIDGYVIAANKNSPKMTVIAGDTPSVKQAVQRFESLDINCVVLQTSHAFHSSIVEPAAEPLRRFLEGLEINLPEIPITSNVDGGFYPMSRDPNRTAKQQVLDKLAPQMASAVEWTKQIETMYTSGARLFIEVGPKRALTVFASQILENRPHLSMMTNHPKFGGIPSLFNALAEMAVAGRPYRWPRSDSPLLTEGFRAGPLEAWEEVEEEPVDAPIISEQKETISSEYDSSPSVEVSVEEPSIDEQQLEIEWIASILSGVSGYPVSMCRGNVDLRSGLGLSDDVVKSVFNSLQRQGRVAAGFDTSGIKTAAQICDWVEGVPDSFRESATSITTKVPVSQPNNSQGQVVERVVEKIVEKVITSDPHQSRKEDPFVITGVSLGLPGKGKVFDDDNFEKLVRGETCISEVPDEYKQKILDKNIVRLIKGRDGQARMEAAEEFSDIPQLAGLAGDFDITAEFGVDAKVARSWDTSTQLAVAAGLIALRDAGIPLTPVEKIGKGGLRLITSWQVPQIYRDRTGVIFSCCFPGTAKTVNHSANNGADQDGRFDRSYLFQILNMGHSQFAQYTGIRGPNSTINLACASTAASFTLAEDWLTTGRCDRVVIISADNVTGPDLWEWIGSGFAASGAASTNNVIEDSALPFDARRNGLILGMGAAAFVIEKKSDAAERGVQPYSELLGAHIANSSYHGTRLDVEHVAAEVDRFVSQMEDRWGLNRKDFAPETFFYSHETYTPARGGSAQAEVRALRETFGDATDSLVISNTKGFTGHPMGAGIEDASMVHALHTGRAPPIANHKVSDPELGNLNLSKGGYHENMRYGLRFAAGFGSQVAITFMRACKVEGDRIDMDRLMSWNKNLAGTDDLQLKVLNGKLVAYLDGENNLHGGVQGDDWIPVESVNDTVVQEPVEKEPEVEIHSTTVAEKSSASSQVISNLDKKSVSSTVVDVVVEHTGYPADFIELDQDLEGELGIDTVKQAEIMGDIREKFSLPVDESFVLSEHPTLNHMIEYILNMSNADNSSESVSSGPEIIEDTVIEPEPEEFAPAPISESEVESTQEATSIVSDIDRGQIESVVMEVVVDHTGYPEDFIELDQDLEGELGIDTVKQAEMMGDIRERFSLPVDESFSLAEHPTLNHFVEYIVKMQSGTVIVSSIGDEPQSEVISQPITEIQSETIPEPEIKPEPEPEIKPVISDSGTKSESEISISTPEVEAKVLQVVVDHTGYPQDFIELDQDLEGELGIDTVKQAEMMGDIRELFELPVDEQFSLAEHPTLNHFVEYIIRMKGGSMTPSEPDKGTVEGQIEEIPWRWSENVVSEVLSEYHLTDREELIEIAKKHDDGNRYLKREEIQAGAEELKNAKMTWRYSDKIVTEVMTEFGLDNSEALVEAAKKHDDGNRYLKKEELEAGARDLVVVEPPPEREDDSPLVNRVVPDEQSQAATLQTSPREGVRRWQVEVEEAVAEVSPILLEGTLLITDDGIGISEEMCTLLKSRGINAIRVAFELELKEMIKEEYAGQVVYRVDPSEESQIKEMCEDLEGNASNSSLCGVLHLAPVQLSGSSWNIGASGREATLASHSLFGMLKYLDGKFANSPSVVVASLSAMDGRHGNIGERFNSLACGAAGIVKSYAHERAEIRCRAWDMHPELAADTQHLAELLLDDLLQNGGDVEIGIDKDLRRWRLVMFDEELVAKPTPLQSDDVWLVSGGGSGVTSAAINGLANSCRNAGAMFILLGRTEAMDEPAGWLSWSEEQLNQRKMQLREELVAASDSGKVSMVEWNNAWQPYLRSRDIHDTIAKIRKTGNKAIYRACDVTDLTTLKDIAKRQGPITGIVHGAGIEDSKLVAEKTWSTFSNVVSIKVDGWKALVSAAEYSGGELRFAACFTSVAGRLGNGGQTDYAAANSILDAEMARLTAKNDTTRAVATAWTGWKDVGMATRGSLEKIFEAAGIETIPVEKGVTIFVDEVLRGGKRRVMGCGSMGVMDKFDSFRAPPLKLPPMMAGLISDPSRFPFVDRLLELQEGEKMISECLLSTDTHPFLIDHSIDGVPYHPGVMALEMFAENALLLQPEFCLAGFENVEFGLPIKLVKGPQKVRVVSELVRRKRDHFWVSCHLESDLVNSKGEIFGKPRIHHKATVRLVRKSNDLTRHMSAELHDIPDIGVPVSAELQHHSSFIYLRFFHGPRFQSHGGIIRGFSEGEMRGADGIALMRHQLPETNQFAAENNGETVLLEALPMLVEAGFQNAGLVTMESDSLMSLPVGIEWMTILAVPEHGEKLRVRSVRRLMEESGISVHDVVVVGEDNSPLLSLRGLRLKAMAPLAEEMKFTLDG